MEKEAQKQIKNGSINYKGTAKAANEEDRTNIEIRQARLKMISH